MCTLTDEALESELVCDSVSEGGLLELDHVSIALWPRETDSSSEVSAGVSAPVNGLKGEGPKKCVCWDVGGLIGKDVIRLFRDVDCLLVIGICPASFALVCEDRHECVVYVRHSCRLKSRK